MTIVERLTRHLWWTHRLQTLPTATSSGSWSYTKKGTSWS